MHPTVGIHAEYQTASRKQMVMGDGGWVGGGGGLSLTSNNVFKGRGGKGLNLQGKG